jgi:hypothetical protein
MVLACERCHAPLLKFAQLLFALNDTRVRFVNARRCEFTLMQEFLDNRNRFRRDVRIVLELIRDILTKLVTHFWYILSGV